MSLTEQNEPNWTTVNCKKVRAVEMPENDVKGAQVDERERECMSWQSEVSSHGITASEEGTASILSLSSTEFETIEPRTASSMELYSLKYNCPDFGEQEDWPAAGEWTVVLSKRSRKAWALQDRLVQQDWFNKQGDLEEENVQGLVPKVRSPDSRLNLESTAVEGRVKSVKGKKTKKTKKSKKRKAEGNKSQNMRDLDLEMVEEPQKKDSEPAKETAIKATKARPQKKKKKNAEKTRSSKKTKVEPEAILECFSKQDNLVKMTIFILVVGLGALLLGIVTR